MGLDDRKIKILSTIVDQYIKTGEPVGSKTISNLLSVSVSPATIRNDMAILEKQGFLQQPHTSSGRIPSYDGYRIYIQEFMRPSILTQEDKDMIDNLLEYQNLAVADNVIESGLDILSEITGCMAVGSVDVVQFSVIVRVEVIPTGRRLYALLVITSTGSVKNKVCRVEFDLLDEHIEFFGNLINKNLSGLNINELDQDLIDRLTLALGSYVYSLAPLLKTLYDIGQEFCSNKIGIKGENKLLYNKELRSDEIIDLFSNKRNGVFNLLSSTFEGIHVVFGKENDNFVITNSSLIMSKYKFGPNRHGSLGIIGPIRLDYNKIIPYIEYFSDRVSNYLYSGVDDDDLGGEINYGGQKKGEKKR